MAAGRSRLVRNGVRIQRLGAIRSVSGALRVPRPCNHAPIWFQLGMEWTTNSLADSADHRVGLCLCQREREIQTLHHPPLPLRVRIPYGLPCEHRRRGTSGSCNGRSAFRSCCATSCRSKSHRRRRSARNIAAESPGDGADGVCRRLLTAGLRDIVFHLCVDEIDRVIPSLRNGMTVYPARHVCRLPIRREMR
jgi:hypothetical protein